MPLLRPLRRSNGPSRSGVVPGVAGLGAGRPPGVPGSRAADPDDPSGVIRAEVVGALALVAAMAVALVWANVPGSSYRAVWGHPLPGALGNRLDLSTARDLVNSVLLTIFFLAVGLEVGRERADGALRETRRALLPVAAALGGMAGAALAYLVAAILTGGGATARQGWGVPMATDVAFTLAAIALLGRRVPRAVRVFVLALAVADDVASVVVLAATSTRQLHPLPVAAAVVVLAVVGIVVRRRVTGRCWPYLLALVVVWLLLAAGGVEPPLAGAFVGMLVPCGTRRSSGERRPSPSARIERIVLPLSTWVVLPLFALANTGVAFRGALVGHATARSVLVSVVVARLAGKVAGICAVTALLVRLGVARLPAGGRWPHLLGIGVLCGMGFTVPILFAESAFTGDGTLIGAAELGLLIGTVLAGVVGTGLLVLAGRRAPPRRAPRPDRAR